MEKMKKMFILLLVLGAVSAEVVFNTPQQIIGVGIGVNSPDCTGYRAGKATYNTPTRIFYTGRISHGFSFTSSGTLTGDLRFSIVKFDVVGNTTKPVSTSASPNPIPFPPTAPFLNSSAVSLSPPGLKQFDIFFDENQQCHPCFLQIQQFSSETVTYSHCTEIGVFSRLNDRVATIVVKKGANEAILQPDTVRARLTTGSFATRGFVTDAIEVSDAQFVLDESGQYSIRVVLIDNPDGSARQMAYILQTENVGQVLGVNVVGVTIDGQGENPSSFSAETLIAIFVAIAGQSSFSSV
jgi:hypothetical protein